VKRAHGTSLLHDFRPTWQYLAPWGVHAEIQEYCSPLVGVAKEVRTCHETVGV
jgi:hypothetical protein